MRFRAKDMKRKIWAIGVGLAITFFHLYWMNTSNQLLIEIRQRLDWIIYDMQLFYNLEKNPEPSSDIVLIDMDERSLTEPPRVYRRVKPKGDSTHDREESSTKIDCGIPGTGCPPFP